MDQLIDGADIESRHRQALSVTGTRAAARK
jgi:hypothetical protein